MHVLKVNYQSVGAPALFAKSLKETGFAVLTHHPIASNLVESVYAEWQEFFASQEKYQYYFDMEKQDGYVPQEISETAKNNEVKDLKEFYHFYGWGRCPEKIRPETLQLFQDITDLASTLLQWLEDNTPESVAEQFSMPLSDMIRESNRTLLRIIHYPPLTGNEPPGAVRAAPHEDINLLTLLPAATTKGLEILDRVGRWHEVTCDYENLVVNAGDMLQMCSQHYYRSATHRVVNPTGEAAKEPRLSMPLFLHPRDEVRLSPTHLATEYRMERLREIGLVTND